MTRLHYLRRPLLAAAIILAFMASSCSDSLDSAHDALVKYASDDCEAVVSFRAKELFQAFEKTNISQQRWHLSRTVLNNPYVRGEDGAFIEELTDRHDIEISVIGITDRDDFIRALADTLSWETGKHDGYLFAQNADSTHAVLAKGSVAMTVRLDNGPLGAERSAAILDSMAQVAGKNPLSQRKLDILAADYTGNAVASPGVVCDRIKRIHPIAESWIGILETYITERIGKGYFAVHLDTGNDMLTLDIEARQADGSPQVLFTGRPCDPNLLPYIPSREAVMFACGDVRPMLRFVTQWQPGPLVDLLDNTLTGPVVVALVPAPGYTAQDNSPHPNAENTRLAAAAYCNPETTAKAIDTAAKTLRLLSFAKVVDHKPGTSLTLDVPAGQAPTPGKDYWEDDYYHDINCRVYIRRDGNVLTVRTTDDREKYNNVTPPAILRKGLYVFTAISNRVSATVVCGDTSVKCTIKGKDAINIFHKTLAGQSCK